MELKIFLETVQYGNGLFQVSGANGTSASLFWARETGPLPGWTEFAQIPICSNGTGTVSFSGNRAIPSEATHVFAKTFPQSSNGLKTATAPLPPRNPQPEIIGLRLAVLTDLHLTKKPWQLRRALERAKESDALLLLGDLINDGLPEQFELLKACIEEVAPKLPILAVSGNHDYPPAPVPTIGGFDFPHFQDWLFGRLSRSGWGYEQDRSGAYAVNLGNVEIIGLTAGSHWRNLGFSQDGQLTWLEKRLAKSGLLWRVLLCHAPLRRHNPLKNPQPYLGMDRELQRIIDRHKNVIFLSGHTHLSCNCREGCVEMDEGNLYANLSSLCPSVLRPAEPLAPPSWTSPAIHQIRISESEAEFSSRELKSGMKYSRGYYRFKNIEMGA